MDDDGKVWKWEVWPHPYSNDFDCFVTDSDDEAREAISNLAEMYLWDGNDGGERIVKVVHNVEFSGTAKRSFDGSAGTKG